MEKEPHNTVSDGVVLLRPFTVTDAEAHIAGEDDDQVKWLSGGKGSIQTATAWIQKNEQYWKDDGPVFNFAIERVEDGILMGMVEANIDPQQVEGLLNGEANISYGIYPQFRRQGFASRAITLLMRFLSEKDIKEAVIRVRADNGASIGLAESLGFTEVFGRETKQGEWDRVFTKKL